MVKGDRVFHNEKGAGAVIAVPWKSHDNERIWVKFDLPDYSDIKIDLVQSVSRSDLTIMPNISKGISNE